MHRRSFLALFSSAVVGLTVKSLVPDVDVTPLLEAFEAGEPVPLCEGIYQPKQLLWTPDQPLPELPAALRRHNLLGLDGLTREILRATHERLPATWRGHLAGPEYRLGDHVRLPPVYPSISAFINRGEDITVTCPVGMITDTYAIETAPELMYHLSKEHRPDPAYVYGAVIAPIAAQLARVIQDKRLIVFGQLPMAHGVEQCCVVRDSASGLCLRGLRQFDVRSDLTHTRFDLMGGPAV